MAGGSAGGATAGGSTAGGSTITYLSDGGSYATLSGDTAFTPVGVVAGRVAAQSLNIAFHDFAPAGSACNGTIPNGSTAEYLRFNLYKADGGTLTTGVYSFNRSLPSDAYASLIRQTSGPTGVTQLAAGVSGEVTIDTLTSTRITGSFNAVVGFADAGMGTLWGNFGSEVCP